MLIEASAITRSLMKELSSSSGGFNGSIAGQPQIEYLGRIVLKCKVQGTYEVPWYPTL